MSDDDLGYGLFGTDIRTIDLASTLDAGAAAELRAMILAEPETTERFELNAASVLRIGTPCIQILLAIGRHLARSGRGMTLRAPSDAVRSAFADLGLSDELDKWSTATHG